MEKFIKGTSIDYLFDFGDMDYADMDSIDVTIHHNGSAVAVYSKLAGDITAGQTAKQAALTIPSADTTAWGCGTFNIELKYVYDGQEPKVELYEGGNITDAN